MSKLADTVDVKLAKGVEYVELSIVRLLVLIFWQIFSALKNGALAIATSVNSLENAVYLQLAVST